MRRHERKTKIDVSECFIQINKNVKFENLSGHFGSLNSIKNIFIIKNKFYSFIAFNGVNLSEYFITKQMMVLSKIVISFLNHIFEPQYLICIFLYTCYNTY